MLEKIKITVPKNTYDILVKDITIAAIGLHEEVSFVGTNLYYYDINGNTGNIIQASDKITINLQTLVSNGFLNGVNNLDENDSLLIFEVEPQIDRQGWMPKKFWAWLNNN